MKRILVFLIIMLFLTLQSFAFEIPSGKVINEQAIIKGIEAYSLKIKSNPKSEDAYINRAFLYFLKNNLEAAIADYDSLILINPNNEEFYLNRGYLKHISQKTTEALKDYDMALKIKPDYAFAHNNRGVALAELGRNKESLIAYNTAININPDYADAYYNRGNLNSKTEKNKEALADYNTAIKLNPTDSATFNNRGVVKRKLNYNVGALSDDITAFANRGRLKKRYYDSEGAEEDFKIAISIAEEKPVVVKQIDIQSKIVNNEIKKQETNPIYREPKVSTDNIQKIAYKTNDTNTILQQNHVIASTHANEQKILKQENPKPQIVKQEKLPIPNPVKKQPEINTKPVENPKLAECYYIRALQKYILQNREGALKDFNMAIQYNPNFAEAYYYRAAIKRDFKDEDFINDYKQAISLNPKLKSVDDADVLNILKI